MATSSSIQIPQWIPEIDLFSVSLETEMSYQATRVDEFVSKVQACFDTIVRIGGDEKPSLQTKYNYLAKLKKSITSCYASDARLIKLSEDVDQNMQKFKKMYQTVSAAYVATLNGGLANWTPQVDSKSSHQAVLKLKVDNLKDSFSKLIKLGSTQKVYGILELASLIKNTGGPEENNRSNELREFVKKNVTPKELASAFEYLQSKDRLNEKAINLLDPNGEMMATYHLQSNSNWEDKAILLAEVLIDRSRKNPVRSLRNYLLDWPKRKEDLQLEIPKTIVSTLLEMQRNSKIEDEQQRLVYEYLLNVLDSVGHERLNILSKSLNKKNLGKFSSKVANVLRSITRFTGTFPEEVFKRLQLSTKTQFKSKFAETLANMKAGTFKENESKSLASLLKYEVVRKLTIADLEGKSFDKTFPEVSLEISQFGDRLRKLIQSEIASCQSEKEKNNLAKAFLRLVIDLKNQGELNLANSIYQELDNLKILKDDKEMAKLADLFDARCNFAGVTKAIKKASVEYACTPFVGSIPRQLSALNDSIKPLIDEIYDLCKPYAPNLDRGQSWKCLVEKFDLAPGDSKKPAVRKELIESIDAVVFLEQKYADICEKFRAEVLALRIYPLGSPTAECDFIKKLLEI